jgi:DNA repair exonuclease SbcCD ATPase subunit
MMGLAQGSPGPEEIIKIATAMTMPAAAKARLQDIAQQLDALNRRSAEIASLQKQADVDRAAIDKRAAELNEDNARKAASLDAREAALQARVAKFEAAVARFDQGLAAREAELGAPHDVT